ncbi:MAG TPA: PAS domain S-box protein [Allosphingosinicella sp.]|jgi:PAS domain S-box-containing protein
MTNAPDPAAERPAFLNGGGELADLIAGFNWAETPLGPLAGWDATLRTTVALMLRSPVPLVTLWGADGVMIYNDAYSVFAGGRHPALLGSKVREGWPEVADFNDHVMDAVLARGGTLSYRDQELVLHRSGRPEQVWMNLDYSPVLGEDGSARAVMAIVVETTGKVRAERRLAGEHERLRQLFDQAPGFTAMMDGPAHVFTMANDAYRRLVGGRDVIGKPVSEAIPEAAAQGFIALLDGVYESGEAFVGRNTPIVLANEGGGEEARFLDFVYQPILDAGGAVSGIFVQGQDVTEERRSLDALREREAQLSAYISQSAAGFAEVDLSGTFTLVNDRFCEIAGRSREELLTLKMQEITHPDDLPANLPKFERAVREGVPFTHEKRYVRPDGSTVWVSNSVSLTRKVDGTPRGVLAVSLDITDRRRAEAAIRENEARLRALTDNLPGGMVYQVYTGVDGTERRFLYVSQSFEKLYGLPAEAVTEDPLLPYKLVHEDDVPRLMAAEEEAISGRRPFDEEMRFRRADGEWRWSRLISAPRAQPDGSIIWDGIQIDITERKQAETAVLRMNETLEERVRERTAELERVHEQLRQSQKLEAMGQLTGGVAHDFNNLLTPIIGSLDMLERRGVGGAREQRLVGAALEAAERAKTLVQRLLAFARRQPLQPGPVRLAGVVGGMADLVASTSGPKVRLHADVPDDLPPALADRNQLEMAILNLCVNARDAMPEGGTLSISAQLERVEAGHRAQLAPGDYLRLSVSDTGVGMDEATQAKAIEPFFSTKGIGKGTGLGLSMVHGLTSQLGGALCISSRPGLGTTIDLLLPRAGDETEAAETQRSGAEPRGAGLVLLVDDEPAVRTSTAEMLGELGYRVVEMTGAREALAWLASNRADYVVTDHLMPGMSGTDLAHAIAETHPGLPTLIVSGYAEIDGISADLPRLAKPFRQSELADCMAALRG